MRADIRSIGIDEQEKADLAMAINDLIKLHETGKADADYLTYIGYFCLGLAKKARSAPRQRTVKTT